MGLRPSHSQRGCKEEAAHAVGPVAAGGQAATVSPGAGEAKVSVHVRRPPITVGRGNKTREKDFIRTSWELKGRRSNSQ